MSSLPGGAADKLGNRYEDWWTLCRVADVLRGRAASIRLEPPGEAGVGVEFYVDGPDGRWYEQVKDQPAGGNWTPRRLSREGVLSSLLGHLAAGHSIRLVVSTPAPDLNVLSSRARAASTPVEYYEILTQEQRPSFQKVAKDWDVTESTAWDYLRRVHVEHHPPENLRRLVHMLYEMLVQGDSEVVINELRGWLDDMLHQTLTAPMIWAHLTSKGLARRLLVGDPATLDALAATVARQHRRVETALPASGAVTQPHSARLVERLCAPDGRQVLVLHGRAGSGKSTVVADALQVLTPAGWFACVVRMDAPTSGSHTAVTLGRVFDLSASPAVLLAGVADSSPAVLVVDQLDAVSNYSGRMPDSYEAVAELLDQTVSLPNVKVVLAVRTVDLEADPRMRSLLAGDARVETLKIEDLELDDVKEALEKSGVHTAALTGATLELLRVPLHLAVFSRLAPNYQAAAYRTLSDLYEQFTDEVRTGIERGIGHLDWDRIASALVQYMSENERLNAPAGLLDLASRLEVTALESAGVLVADQGRVGFFHETYFDFLFARGFVASGRDLHDFLVDSGQHLFRRAQVRQVLEYLAVTDRERFRRDVVRLLSADDIRVHLQNVVITVLAQLEADADDWRALEPLAFAGSWHARRLMALLSLPHWFDAADMATRWEALLADPSTVDVAAHQIVFAARERPERVAELVRPFIGASDQWRHRLRVLVEWSLRPELVGLAIELVNRGDLDDARGPIAINSDFWSILYGLHEEDAAGAARLMGAHLRRVRVLAEAEGSRDPFASGHIDSHSPGGSSLIGEVAAAAPVAFLDEVLPFVVDVAEATATAGEPSMLRTSASWGWRHTGDHHDIDGALFSGIEEALRRLAKDRPDEAAALVESLAASDVEELRFLACRTLAAAGAGDPAVDWLLSDERNFRLGWADSPRWASRELVEVASRVCDAEHLEALVCRLLEYYPVWETAADRRRLRGHAQYELLSAVEPSRRSEAVTRRLGELQRKFADAPPTPPQPVEAHIVGPPITQQAAGFLTDEQWTRAVRKYRSDQTDWSRNVPVGGATELAELLGTQAKANPERFAQLAVTFDADTPSVYFSRVIEAVAGTVSIPKLAELCHRARQVAGQDVGRAICRAVETVGADADDNLLSLIEECATDDDPNFESARTPAGSGQPYYSGDLFTAGLNSTRGAAGRTLAHLLFAGPEHADRLTPTIAALATDPILAVRTCAAEAARALMNHRPEVALAIANDLFTDAPVDVFDSVITPRLLRVALFREPEAFAPHLRRALDGPESVAERAGPVWAFAFVQDLLDGPLPTDLAALSSAARRGAAEAFAADPTIAPQQLARLFNDDDPTVRKAAASAMRTINDVDTSISQMLTAAFVGSAAYEEHFDDLFRALARSSQLLPEAAMIACEQAVDIANSELGDIRTSRAATSPDIVTVVLRLYRQGDEAIRRRSLDVIDKLSQAGAYGLEEALATER